MLRAMATAPKDGTIILVVTGPDFGVTVAPYYWRDGAWRATEDTTEGDYSGYSAEWAGWFECPADVESILRATIK